jgi:hypothetical protein
MSMARRSGFKISNGCKVSNILRVGIQSILVVRHSVIVSIVKRSQFKVWNPLALHLKGENAEYYDCETLTFLGFYGWKVGVENIMASRYQIPLPIYLKGGDSEYYILNKISLAICDISLSMTNMNNY